MVAEPARSRRSAFPSDQALRMGGPPHRRRDCDVVDRWVLKRPGQVSQASEYSEVGGCELFLEQLAQLAPAVEVAVAQGLVEVSATIKVCPGRSCRSARHSAPWIGTTRRYPAQLTLLVPDGPQSVCQGSTVPYTITLPSSSTATVRSAFAV